MTWYEALLWLGGGAGAIAAIVKLVKPFVQAVKERLSKIDEMSEDMKAMQAHDQEQYLAILRLTVMAPEMPVSERIIAGKTYIDKGGNGDVKAYYEQLIDDHIK